MCEQENRENRDQNKNQENQEKRDLGNTCIECGDTVADPEFDPETGEGPFCTVCMDDRGHVDFDFGESDECDD